MRLLAVGIAVTGMLAAGLPAANAADDAGPTTGAEAVSSAVENADTSQTGSDVVAPKADSDPSDGTTVVAADLVAHAPAAADGIVSVTSRIDGGTIGVGLPTDSTVAAAVSESGAVTYPDPRSDVAVAVRVFDSGVQISTVLGSPAADHDFAYPVDLPAGAHIEKTPDGGVVFLAADGSPLGGFAAPWAKDKDGNTVATSYEVQGLTVVQHVQQSTAEVYPIVADPYLWIDLIQSATFVWHSGYGWTMEVTPTTWARANSGSYQVGVYDWNELYSKYKDKGLNTNLAGMEDQLICHQQIVAVRDPGKATWNLDEWRPSVGYLQTVNASCNPGGATFFD